MLIGFCGEGGLLLKFTGDEVPPEVKATDPENRLTFITGPLAGVSPGVAGIRWLVCGKSPAANPEQFSYSSLGGNWGTELKFAGYDGIIVQGKSDKPVYISIQKIKSVILVWKTRFFPRLLVKRLMNRGFFGWEKGL